MVASYRDPPQDPPVGVSRDLPFDSGTAALVEVAVAAAPGRGSGSSGRLSAPSSICGRPPDLPTARARLGGTVGGMLKVTLVLVSTVAFLAVPTTSGSLTPSAANAGAHRSTALATSTHYVGSFTFAERDGRGRPARWNPCERIQLVVNPRNAPPGALPDLRAAVALLARVSGYRLVLSGPTSSAVTSDWGTTEARTGGRWPAVLVAGSMPDGYALPDDGSSGLVRTAVIDGPGDSKDIVSGSIVFNARQNSLYTSGSGAGGHRVELYLHELGHILGLGHARDEREVICPVIGGASGLGPGDRAGLRALLAGGCRRPRGGR